MKTSQDNFFHHQAMGEALKLAQQAYAEDEVPVGAVITHNQQIIARAHNQVETLKDPTAHAEMIAITQATHHFQTKWLQDCNIYITVEPCSMCAGALVLARIKNIFFGCADPKTGACGSVLNLVQHQALNHHINCVGGLLNDECAYLMRSFFEKKRDKSSTTH